MSKETQPVKMWSGRFREPLDDEFEAWQRSIVFDWQLLEEEVAASKAHASALAAAGVGSLGRPSRPRRAPDADAAAHASEEGQALGPRPAAVGRNPYHSLLFPSHQLVT